MREILIGSLFAGIGGLEKGIEVAIRKAGMMPRVAWQVEANPYCREVLAKHWPYADRSIFDVKSAGKSLRAVSVVCGGPPCQEISGAGSQAGLHGERSGLLFEYIRTIRELRPDICVAENVYGGKWREWLDAIRCGLVSANYGVRAGIIRAADVGAPHLRRRIFVLGYARGARRKGPEWSSCNRECERPSDGSGGEGRGPVEIVAALGRDDHGLPDRLDAATRWPARRFEAQHAWEPPRTVPFWRGDNRHSELRGLGNAVVPDCSEAVARVLVVPYL